MSNTIQQSLPEMACNACSRFITAPAFEAGYSALAAYAFSIVSPGTAAIYGATKAVLRGTMQCATDSCSQEQNQCQSIAKATLIWAASATGAAFIANGLGSPITAGAVVSLTAATILIDIATCCCVIVPVCGCLAAVMVALGIGEAAGRAATAREPNEQPSASSKNAVAEGSDLEDTAEPATRVVAGQRDPKHFAERFCGDLSAAIRPV